MASSRQKATNENISTYGVSKDYGEGQLGNWETDKTLDIVAAAQSEVLECYDDTADFDDTLDAAGATTNATYFRIVRSASGEGHDGTTNVGVDFKNLTATVTWKMNEDYFQTQDLIIRMASTAGGAWNMWLDEVETRAIGVLVFDNDTVSGTVREFLLFSATNPTMVNCLCDNGENTAIRIDLTGATAYIYNCTILGNASDGVQNANGTVVCKNVLSDNIGEDFEAGTYTGSVNCASGDATSDNLPAGNHRKDQTFTFESSGGNDFHLASGDAGAKDFGADLSSDSHFAFDDDVNDGTMGAAKAGQTFSTWDIGMDEPNPPGGADAALSVTVRRRSMQPALRM